MNQITITDFQNLFVKANLNKAETDYFFDDARNVISKLDIESPEQYYRLKETQYCVVEYAFLEFKGIAKSGLKKLLKAIEAPSETIFNAGSDYIILKRAGNNLFLRRESDGIYVIALGWHGDSERGWMQGKYFGDSEKDRAVALKMFENDYLNPNSYGYR